MGQLFDSQMLRLLPLNMREDKIKVLKKAILTQVERLLAQMHFLTHTNFLNIFIIHFVL